MLNFRELLDWLDVELYYCEDYTIDKKYPADRTCKTPLKYIGIYEWIGVATVWDDCGSITHEFDMYRPVGSGTVLYDVE